MGNDCEVVNNDTYMHVTILLLFRNSCNMYGLLTKCEVKMAGDWSSSFFACLWTETKSRSINSQLDRTNLVNKGFIKFFLRETAGSPDRA